MANVYFCEEHMKAFDSFFSFSGHWNFNHRDKDKPAKEDVEMDEVDLPEGVPISRTQRKGKTKVKDVEPKGREKPTFSDESEISTDPSERIQQIMSIYEIDEPTLRKVGNVLAVTPQANTNPLALDNMLKMFLNRKYHNLIPLIVQQQFSLEQSQEIPLYFGGGVGQQQPGYYPVGGQMGQRPPYAYGPGTPWGSFPNIDHQPPQYAPYPSYPQTGRLSPEPKTDENEELAVVRKQMSDIMNMLERQEADAVEERRRQELQRLEDKHAMEFQAQEEKHERMVEELKMSNQQAIAGLTSRLDGLTQDKYSILEDELRGLKEQLSDEKYRVLLTEMQALQTRKTTGATEIDLLHDLGERGIGAIEKAGGDLRAFAMSDKTKAAFPPGRRGQTERDTLGERLAGSLERDESLRSDEDSFFFGKEG